MIVFTLVVLAFFWWSANHSVAIKIVATILVLSSFGLLLLGEPFYLFFIAQLVLIIALGVSTFGVEWLNQRVR